LWQTKPDEETRKVQFTGGSTYIISLPKSWITQNQIKKGSFIKFRQEEGGLLTIVPPDSMVQKRLEEAIIKVLPNDDTEMITRKMVSAYLGGYNSILIKTDKQALSTKQRHEIKGYVRRMLIGTEIVNDTSAQLILQVLLSYPELTIQNALRRMTIITTSMHRDALLGLKTNDAQLAREVMLTDNEVDRFNLYVTRQLRMAIQNPRMTKEIGLDSGKDCLGYRIITKLIERTADHAVNIAEYTLALKNPLSDATLQKIEKMSNLSVEMFNTAMEALFREDYNSAESIITSIKEISALEKNEALSPQMDIEDAANLRLIIESIRRTAEYACDIAEIVLNLSVDSVLV
jgi:phosphate uptake regulator